VAWLEARAACGGKIDEKAMKALRRGWYLGEATFGDRLLDMIMKPSAKKSRASELPKAHGEAEAERLAGEALSGLGLPADPKELAKLRKGDGRKVLVACLIRQRTAAGNPWMAKRLAMGHPGSVSRLVVAAVKHSPTMRELEKLSKLLKCVT
jgi:hypothetical protein